MPDTESKLSGWECQGWEAEVLNLSSSSRVKSVSKHKKKRPSLESKDILIKEPVSVMLIFTDASQVSEKACLAKAQRNRARLKAQRTQDKLKVDDEECVHRSTGCSHDLPLFQNRCHWTIFKGCLFLQLELLKRHGSQSWLEFKLLQGKSQPNCVV